MISASRKLVFSATMSCLFIALLGCEKKSETAVVAAPTPAPVQITECGNSPLGELTAERIVSANTTRTEPGLYEGPVWINGALYFSDFIFTQGFSSRIQRLNADGSLTVVLDDSGTNGLAVDAQGHMVAGTHKYKSVSRFNISNWERLSVAEKYNGNVFNSPNDLTVANDGAIYFTDPDYQSAAAPGGQPKTSVYRIALNGDVTLVDDTLKNPNGVAISQNNDVLYVSGGTESGAVVRAYPIVNGVPLAGKDFITGIVAPDGMTLDCHGNLYVTEHTEKHVRVFTPQGQQISTINIDAKITNVAFGGADGKTLFITGMGGLWKIDLDVTGLPY